VLGSVILLVSKDIDPGMLFVLVSDITALGTSFTGEGMRFTGLGNNALFYYRAAGTEVVVCPDTVVSVGIVFLIGNSADTAGRSGVGVSLKLYIIPEDPVTVRQFIPDVVIVVDGLSHNGEFGPFACHTDFSGIIGIRAVPDIGSAAVGYGSGGFGDGGYLIGPLILADSTFAAGEVMGFGGFGGDVLFYHCAAGAEIIVLGNAVVLCGAFVLIADFCCAAGGADMGVLFHVAGKDPVAVIKFIPEITVLIGGGGNNGEDSALTLYSAYLGG